MSAVESLVVNNTAKMAADSGADYLDTLKRRLGDDIDSDEESFHLYLSDGKEEDANKNEEEEERVTDPVDDVSEKQSENETSNVAEERELDETAHDQNDDKPEENDTSNIVNKTKENDEEREEEEKPTVLSISDEDETEKEGRVELEEEKPVIEIKMDVGNSEMDIGKVVVCKTNDDSDETKSDNAKGDTSEDFLAVAMVKDTAQDDADMAEDALLMEEEANEELDEGEKTSEIENSDEATMTPKRMSPIDDEDNGEPEPKKMRLEEEEDEEEPHKTVSPPPSPEQQQKSKTIEEDEKSSRKEVDITMTFSKFLRDRQNRLTMSDLEIFTLQKICEAIVHKSPQGDLNDKLRAQERTIESLRREQVALMKQLRDLEIVNRKLLNEVKTNLGNKPLVPMKITRSVGLQVRLPPLKDLTPKRNYVSTPNVNRTPVLQNSVNTRPRQTLNNNRQISKVTTPVTKPPQRTTPPAQVRNRPAISRKTPAEPAKSTNPTNQVVDLTDDDDKKGGKAATTTSSNVRLNTTPKTPTGVAPGTPVMYLVQSNSQIKQGLLTGSGQPKALLVNFQANGGAKSNVANSKTSSTTPNVSVLTKQASVPAAGAATAQLSIVPKSQRSIHPAPLPMPPAATASDFGLKPIPPKPVLTIRKTNNGIILQWRMPYDLANFETIATYQLYAYQETPTAPTTEMWRKVGEVKAMALPMACTLTQFTDRNKYHFAVRAIDIHKRMGNFSEPQMIPP